jgi:DoxX-like family
MTKKTNTFLTFLIASVWLVNGLFCKALNFVPRHQEIVGRILGNDYAPILTKAIGLSEILMAIWIISHIKTKINALAQIGIIATMNILAFLLVPDLLLWGRFNSLFALGFILLIYYNEFRRNTNFSS